MTGKCSDPNAWRTQPPLEVSFPYFGEDSAVMRVPTFEPSVPKLRASFDLRTDNPVPPGSIGWDTRQETTYRNVLIRMAEDLRSYGNPALPSNSKAGRQIRELGQAAYDILATTGKTGAFGEGYESIPDLYENDYRRWGKLLDVIRKFPLSEEPKNLPPGIFLGRVNLRHAIIDAYATAAQLLWCASLGKAEVESYWENRQRYEASIKPGDPTQIASPEWANYRPIPVDASDPRLPQRESDVEVEFVMKNLQDVQEEQPAATAEPAKISGAVIAVVAAAGIGLAYMFSRRK